MKMPKKPSFFEKLSGAVSFNEDDDELLPPEEGSPLQAPASTDWMENEAEEGQLTVDVYQTANEIVLKTMVAGVEPQDLEVTITRDMVTIKGRREEQRNVMEEDYFFKELYWGSFSRTVLLPEEVDPDEAEAVQRHGLLTIRLPKIDKGKTQQLKIKQG